jgi:hypothetical protein
MANLSGAINRVRRARREAVAPQSGNFERYCPAYEEALEAVQDLADDELFDELDTWLAETTRAKEELPTPAALRQKARELCADYGVEIPDDSPLRE